MPRVTKVKAEPGTLAAEQEQRDQSCSVSGSSDRDSESDAEQTPASDDDDGDTLQVVAERAKRPRVKEEPEDEESTAHTVMAKKVKPEPRSGRTGASPGGVQVVVRKNDRSNMAFAKGTYLIRFQDVGTELDDHLWRVDGHQLLQYYKRVDEQDPQTYQRTNRYTGWLCSEGWKYLKVKVLKKIGKQETVLVDYPNEEIILSQKTDYDKKQKDVAEQEEIQ